MRKLILVLAACLAALSLRAQQYPELGAKLDAYYAALMGETASVQMKECDFLVESCQDSLVRQFVALHIYDHYLRSRIMGDDAVAVHMVDRWFASGAIPMHSDTDLLNAKVFAEFNRSSLVGVPAPSVRLRDPAGTWVELPRKGACSVLYFYDTGCATCKVETGRLKALVAENRWDVSVYAIYVGADASAWEAYRQGFDGVVHLWDPGMESDWQRLYGVLKTPQLVLVGDDGLVSGRGLDTPALRLLLERTFSPEQYVYGEPARMEQLSRLFAPYGDTLRTQDVLDVADYLAARTFGEGDVDAFKQVTGDLLYYLSSRKTEACRDAVAPFVERFIRIPDVWTSAADTLQVLSLADMLCTLSARTPVGEPVPDMAVPGVLRRRPCLFFRDGKEGTFKLRKLKGSPAYVVFYSAGCSACAELLSQVDSLVSARRRMRVLLVDMDAIMTDQPELAGQLLDTFDLSGLPFVLELDRKGIVRHRYVDLTNNH